jgi:N-acetylmuramoyl-L-alanine amidase
MNNVLISFGHTKDEPGACNDEYCEYDFTKLWAEVIVDNLTEDLDEEIILVPEGTLEEKVNFINENEALFCIEIHFNSNVEAEGSESLYYPDSEEGQWIAEKIQDKYEEWDIFQPNRGVKEGVYWENGKVAGTLYLLRSTNCPTVIVESEFIYNTDKILEQQDEGIKALSEVIKELYDEFSD